MLSQTDKGGVQNAVHGTHPRVESNYKQNITLLHVRPPLNKKEFPLDRPTHISVFFKFFIKVVFKTFV